MAKKIKDVELFEVAFINKYKTAFKLLDYWKEGTGTYYKWESFTKANLMAFVDYLSEHCARTSVKTYCAMWKSVINTYTDVVPMPRGWEKILSVKNDVSQNVYLTEDELQAIISYEPQTRTESIVQAQFIVAALTGARHSDAVDFTEENINEDMLIYVSKKTHVKAEVPLSPVVRDWLCSELMRASVTDMTFNTVIRNIAMKCGIDSEMKLYRRGEFVSGKKYEFISSHTARRTFCTLLYLRCKDIYLVSKLAGHSDTKMTEGYICCSIEGMTASALAYFSNFHGRK